MSAALAAVLALAPAYIHFTLTDLPTYCLYSNHVRVLEVEKFDAEAGVVVFTVADTLKKAESPVGSFKQVIDPKANGVKPIFDWVKKGKKAVLLTSEAKELNIATGYTVIDGLWYSVDYNPTAKHWTFLRAEPHLSAVYHGDAEKLIPLLKDLIAGKKVDVPTRKPEAVPNRDDRAKEVNDAMIRNRK